MMCDEILNKYYKNATYKYCPDFDYNDDEIQSELLPGYEYTNWIVWNIFEARPDYEKMLSEDGYDVVYHIVDKYDDNKEFIGIIVDNQLLDITDDLNVLFGEEDDKISRPGYEGDNFTDKLVHGRELYNSYGPDVDPNDLDEYDAECYLAYKSTL